VSPPSIIVTMPLPVMLPLFQHLLFSIGMLSFT
jgi:hypothetical protein